MNHTEPIFQTRRGITRYAQKHYAEPEYSDFKTLEKKIWLLEMPLFCYPRKADSCTKISTKLCNLELRSIADLKAALAQAAKLICSALFTPILLSLELSLCARMGFET